MIEILHMSKWLLLLTIDFIFFLEELKSDSEIRHAEHCLDFSCMNLGFYTITPPPSRTCVIDVLAPSFGHYIDSH